MFLPPALMLLFGDFSLYTLFLWVIVTMACGFTFASIGLTAAHHDPDNFHEGDEPRWVLYKILTLLYFSPRESEARDHSLKDDRYLRTNFFLFEFAGKIRIGACSSWTRSWIEMKLWEIDSSVSYCTASTRCIISFRPWISATFKISLLFSTRLSKNSESSWIKNPFSKWSAGLSSSWRGANRNKYQNEPCKPSSSSRAFPQEQNRHFLFGCACE